MPDPNTPDIASLEQRALTVELEADVHTLESAIEALDAHPDDAQMIADIEGLTVRLEAKTARLQAVKAIATHAEHTGAPAMTGPVIITRQQAPFSVSKLLLGLVDPTFNDWGYEREISQETARKSGRDTSKPHVPWGALAPIRKAQDSITPPSGTPPVDVGQSLARPANDESLFSFTAAASWLPAIAPLLGINVHQAAAGAFFAPRMVGNVQLGWVPRDTAVNNTTATFDSLPADPHTTGAVAEIRRSALIDCSPLMDALITGQLRFAAAAAMDDAVIGHLVALANAPEGLLTVATNGGAFATFAELQAALRVVEIANGTTSKVAIGPAVRDWLGVTSAGDALLGVNAMSAMAAPPAVSVKLDKAEPNKSFVLAGDFTSCHQVVFGAGIEVATNPYASGMYEKGAVLLRVMLDCEFLATDPARVIFAYLDTTPVGP
ncbi:phage major capsid protein [Uliginosibacterium sp. H3]|uniref:Phage major capsid protein n=1 Tax=Uliginosibacterium silvisoli TaxID=3114758 RepID=A0ABU6K5J4_9RHOO|nr:phage major capsid protein [Uliginosibacterium sp. H3]